MILPLFVISISRAENWGYWSYLQKPSYWENKNHHSIKHFPLSGKEVTYVLVLSNIKNL